MEFVIDQFSVRITDSRFSADKLTDLHPFSARILILVDPALTIPILLKVQLKKSALQRHHRSTLDIDSFYALKRGEMNPMIDELRQELHVSEVKAIPFESAYHFLC